MSISFLSNASSSSSTSYCSTTSSGSTSSDKTKPHLQNTSSYFTSQTDLTNPEELLIPFVKPGPLGESPIIPHHVHSYPASPNAKAKVGTPASFSQSGVNIPTGVNTPSTDEDAQEAALERVETFVTNSQKLENILQPIHEDENCERSLLIKEYQDSFFKMKRCESSDKKLIQQKQNK